MILQTKIKNYLSHKNTTIDFCLGMNVITGISDAGKSSVLRPMIWNITNRPTGDGMRNWGCGETDEIINTIITTEGSVEKRRKSDKVIYSLDTKDSQMTFEAFKTDIPEEVSNFFDFSEFNYQSQHSPYFLLNESGGTIAQKLNDLVGLSIIDTMFKNLNSLATSSKKNSEKESKTVQDLQGQIDQLAYLDKIDKELKEIGMLLSEYEKRQSRLSELSLLINAYKDIQKEIENYKPIIVLEDQVVSLLEDIEIYELKNRNLSSLSILIANYKQNQEAIEISKEWLIIEPEVNSLLEDIEQYIARKEKLDNLEKLIASVAECQQKIASEKEWLTVEAKCNEIYPMVVDCLSRQDKLTRLSKLLANYKTLDIDKLTRMLEDVKKEKQELLTESGVCPYCMSELDKEAICRMIV